MISRAELEGKSTVEVLGFPDIRGGLLPYFKRFGHASSSELVSLFPQGQEPCAYDINVCPTLVLKMQDGTVAAEATDANNPIRRVVFEQGSRSGIVKNGIPGSFVNRWSQDFEKKIIEEYLLTLLIGSWKIQVETIDDRI